MQSVRCLSVAGYPGRGAASPLTSTSQWKGQGAPAIGSEAEQRVQEQRTAAVRALGRLGGYKTQLEQTAPGQMSGEQQWRLRLAGYQTLAARIEGKSGQLPIQDSF